jgi:hypothetical protein
MQSITEKKINLKGIMVGNGATNWHLDITPAFLDMAYYHNIMDGEVKKTIE